MPNSSAGSAPVRPSSLARRSPVYRRLEAAGATFAELNGCAVAMDFGGVLAESRRAQDLALADLSPLPRIGFKGPGAMGWLSEQGLTIAGVPNRSRRQAGGELVIARSHTEALILSDLHGRSDLCTRLEAAAEPAMRSRAYALPRFDGLFWFVLTGTRARDCLAKICAIDLRPAKFDDGAVAQTLMVGMSAIVARGDIGNTSAFHLLGDSASAEYFWDCIVDAMAEFKAGPIGLSAIHALGNVIQ